MAEIASPFKNDTLKGLVVIVTGGATGIGYGICEVFAQHGARVAILGRRAEVVQASAARLRQQWPSCEAFGVQGDVRSPEKCAATVAAVVERFGRLDVLVNAAAGNFMALAQELGPKGFKTVVDIDLLGTFNMTHASIDALSLTKSPRSRPPLAGSPIVINITATLQYKATPFQAHASAAKAAIDSLTKTLGVELACDHGVRVVGIAPGPIAGTEGGPTGRVFGAVLAGADVADLVPVARWGVPHDIGLAALFLSSSAGAYVNATDIVADGGQWHDAARGFRLGRDAISAISQERSTKPRGQTALHSKM